MTLKVLPLESWMTSPYALDDCLESGTYKQVSVRFGVPNIYLNGNRCWFELDSHTAYSYPKDDFLYKLRLENALELNYAKAAALQAVVEQKLASPEQRALLRDYRDAMMIRETGRNACKSFLRFHRKQ